LSDFYEKRDGGIRLTLKITPILAETVSLWLEKIESVIKQVEGILLDNKMAIINYTAKKLGKNIF
jgi:hypothetical protein